jgi:hypothetical protein
MAITVPLDLQISPTLSVLSKHALQVDANLTVLD